MVKKYIYKKSTETFQPIFGFLAGCPSFMLSSDSDAPASSSLSYSHSPLDSSVVLAKITVFPYRRPSGI